MVTERSVSTAAKHALLSLLQHECSMSANLPEQNEAASGQDGGGDGARGVDRARLRL